MLAAYLRCYLMFVFFSNFLNFFIPTAKNVILQAQKQILKKILANVPNHPFVKIDEYIFDEYLKENFAENPEIPGTTRLYMDIVMQFFILSTFGIGYPIMHICLFCVNIIQLRV